MPEPRHLAATLEERARAQAPSRQPHASPVVAAPHAAVSPLQREDMERTRRFVRPRGEDLHNTWKEGNEFAQVRVARPPPHTRAVPCPMPLRTTARAARAGAGQCTPPALTAPPRAPAQARQAANMACAPTTHSVLGWWTETSKNRQPSGLRTCRIYHTQKNGQTSFIEAEVSARPRARLAAARALRGSGWWQ